MAKLEEIIDDTVVRGILPNEAVTVIRSVTLGPDLIQVTYRQATGTAEVLLFRDQEPTLEVVKKVSEWNYRADGDTLRLVLEAQRIHLAHLSDPYIAIHSSKIDPLPHQITAVYEAMLRRQPLRFLLADDPGAGKTIMAGLLIKELRLRGDAARCLVICPGSLAEQWQDELFERFGLPFDLLTRERIETSRSGNPFLELPSLIARLDQLARDETLQSKLEQVQWDLVICDEAHKMSASYFGGEVKYTKRFLLGQRLRDNARHFLLMSATPHNGKEEDFQLFMSLLDRDRFEGKPRNGTQSTDTSDLMRRMVKEQLLKFDATPLFPERIANIKPYRLSSLEAELYAEVTAYVRGEFNRAEKLQNDGRARTVGFALTILQRRLASSPEAIYQSLKRRRERLEERLRQEQLLSRGQQGGALRSTGIDEWSEEQLEDLSDDGIDNAEQAEEEIVDQATAARTIEELRIEIENLRKLEAKALSLRKSRTDCKWDELSHLLQDESAMLDGSGQRHKLVIFTEHRDTLNYLTENIRSLLGRTEAVVTIHGGIQRDERRRAQERFRNEKEVLVLVATDAAGEGINLQVAHLMVSYDLPWNPNRLEQRFGRIHRIGQREVCRLWNLVAEETREGEVYLTLLRKLEQERKDLGGAVFDVLGQAIGGKELREMMIEAIRDGDRPEVKARLNRKVEGALNQERLRALIEDHALTHEAMDGTRVRAIRQELERMEARRLQPHYIAGFFQWAFDQFGGRLVDRERGRYEIDYVPQQIRRRAEEQGRRPYITRTYTRVCFDKESRTYDGKPNADFIYPGHPLLDALIELVLEQHRALLTQGAVLVDPNDWGEQPRTLFVLEHAIRDARLTADGAQREVSRRMQFVELPIAAPATQTLQPLVRDAGYAPHLDLRGLTSAEQHLIAPWLANLTAGQDWSQQVIRFAAQKLVPEHLAEVRGQREPLIDKTIAAVTERLTREITYWDNQSVLLLDAERMGKRNAKLNSNNARQRCDELQSRLASRLQQLKLEKQLSPQPPTVVGGALVLPMGLLQRLAGNRSDEAIQVELENKRVEMIAMHAVMQAERELGFAPIPVYRQQLGYDIESAAVDLGAELRMIEVKGFSVNSQNIVVTRNEILTALNMDERWILALVEVPETGSEQGSILERCLLADEIDPTLLGRCKVRYVRKYFTSAPDIRSSGSLFPCKELWDAGIVPK